MKSRTRDALEYADSSRDVELRVPGIPDADLRTPDVDVAIVRRDGPAGDFCGAWSIRVSGRGKTQRFDGRAGIAKAIALAGKRSDKRSRVGVSITTDVPLDEIAPLLEGLSKVGTIQLRLTVIGPPYRAKTDEAPAWAVTRLEAIRKAEHGDEARIGMQKLRESIDASFRCPGVANAFRNVARKSGGAVSGAWLIADEVPKGIASCECRDVDVDALELFVLYTIADGHSKLTEGWLEFRVDGSSATEVKAGSVAELATALGTLSRDQRTAGVKLAAASTKSARCASER